MPTSSGSSSRLAARCAHEGGAGRVARQHERRGRARDQEQQRQPPRRATAASTARARRSRRDSSRASPRSRSTCPRGTAPAARRRRCAASRGRTGAGGGARRVLGLDAVAAARQGARRARHALWGEPGRRRGEPDASQRQRPARQIAAATTRRGAGGCTAPRAPLCSTTRRVALVQRRTVRDRANATAAPRWHAHEGVAEVGQQRGQRAAQQRARAAGVHLDVVVGRLQPARCRRTAITEVRPRSGIRAGRRRPRAGRGDGRRAAQALHGARERVGVDRLEQVVDGGGVEGLQRVAVERGDEDDRRRRRRAATRRRRGRSTSGICTSRNSASGASCAHQLERLGAVAAPRRPPRRRRWAASRRRSRARAGGSSSTISTRSGVGPSVGHAGSSNHAARRRRPRVEPQLRARRRAARAGAARRLRRPTPNTGASPMPAARRRRPRRAPGRPARRSADTSARRLARRVSTTWRKQFSSSGCSDERGHRGSAARPGRCAPGELTRSPKRAHMIAGVGVEQRQLLVERAARPARAIGGRAQQRGQPRQQRIGQVGIAVDQRRPPCSAR